MKTEEPKKDDSEKITYHLIPLKALEQVSRVMEFGAKKYSPNNYKKGKGMQYLRLWNACIRHLFSWSLGEDNDKETGYSHLAHAGCCVLMLLELIILNKGEDNRYKEE